MDAETITTVVLVSVTVIAVWYYLNSMNVSQQMPSVNAATNVVAVMCPECKQEKCDGKCSCGCKREDNSDKMMRMCKKCREYYNASEKRCPHCSRVKNTYRKDAVKRPLCGAMIKANKVPDTANREEFDYDPTRLIPSMTGEYSEEDGDGWGKSVDLSMKNFLNTREEAFSQPDVTTKRTIGFRDVRGAPDSLLQTLDSDYNPYGSFLKSGQTNRDIAWHTRGLQSVIL